MTSNSEWVVIVNVDNNALALEIDTGARCNVISLNSVNKLGFTSSIQSSNIRINGVHGNVEKAYGVVTLPCVYKGQRYHLDFQVLKGKKDINLLGRIDCVKLGLIARVNCVSVNNESSKAIVNEYKDVLGKSIGCIPGEYDIKIDENVHPVVHPPVPFQ